MRAKDKMTQQGVWDFEQSEVRNRGLAKVTEKKL